MPFSHFTCSRTYTRGTRFLFSAVAAAVLLSAGCASEVRAKRFTELLQLYPETQSPLKVRPLPDAALARDPSPRTVTIIVHPAYALFFRNEKRNTYSEAKYDLLEYQLFQETRYIRDAAKKGDIIILVIPGGYELDSIAPPSYTTYLNSMAGEGQAVYFIRSETTHSGIIALDTTVKLHGFLRSIRTSKILIGGGFVGRCQGEFYRQFTTYVENVPTFIVPEISTLSPDDISSGDAEDILTGIRNKDYQLIVDFIGNKGEEPNILGMPPTGSH